MALKGPKKSKQKVAGTRREITSPIPEKLEIIMNPGNATSRSIILAAKCLGC